MEPRETELLCASLITQWLDSKGGVSRIDKGDLSLCRYTESGDLVDKSPVTRSNAPSVLAYLLYNSSACGAKEVALESSDGTRFGTVNVC